MKRTFKVLFRSDIYRIFNLICILEPMVPMVTVYSFQLNKAVLREKFVLKSAATDKTRCLMYMRTAKVHAKLCTCTVSSETSLFTHGIYRVWKSIRHGTRDLGPVNGWVCPYEWTKLKYMLRIHFSWRSLNYFNVH